MFRKKNHLYLRFTLILFIISTISITLSTITFIKYKKLKTRLAEVNQLAELNTSILDNYIQNAIHLNYVENKDKIKQFYQDTGYENPNAYIAHGGGTEQFTYTNSLESIKNSLINRFNFIEIDLIETSDNKIIGGHDWKSFKRITNYKTVDDDPITYDEATNLLINQQLSVATSENISILLEENKDWFLITDKIRNYELLLNSIPYPNRMIVEVFSISDYIKALNNGVKFPAFCIWKPDDIHIVKKYKIPIVTLAAWNFFDSQDKIDMVKQLHQNGVVIFAFGSGQTYWNDPNWVKEHLGKTFSKMYSDKWSPNALP